MGKWWATGSHLGGDGRALFALPIADDLFSALAIGRISTGVPFSLIYALLGATNIVHSTTKLARPQGAFCRKTAWLERRKMKVSVDYLCPLVGLK